MQTYLIRGTYTPESVQALRNAGPASRVEAVQQMLDSVDGKMVTELCWSANSLQAVFLVQLPNDAAAASVLATGLAAGSISVEMERLFTAAELEAAFGVDVQFDAPGQ